jgi:O-antigen/teichoic acid export membrane protein
MNTSGKPPSRVSVARGAVLVVAMRWTDRLIGIASTLILARLLMPADFGIVAMASLVVTLIDTLLDMGVNSALIQNPKAGRDDFDTAWTLRLGQALLAALLIALLGAPLAAGYFNDARVEDVLRFMALTVVLGGIENIGIVYFQKNMEFGRDFRFFFLRRLAGFVITIALALWLRSYWAMVIGALAGRLVGVWLSYALHDFRPRLSLARIKQLWGFSQWILVRNLGAYGTQQLDKILVGRRTDAATLGAYSLADDIAAMPTGELLAPLGRVLFPAFVQAAHDPAELRRTYCLALGVQAIVALPAGVGLALVAETAVPLLLGAQWQAAIPLVQTLALLNVAIALVHGSGYLLLTLGKVRLLAIFSWLQLGMLASLALLAFPQAGAEGIADIRLAVSIIAMLAFLGMVVRAVPGLGWRHVLANVWRPAFATGGMAAALVFFSITPDGAPGLQLVVDVLFGGAVYSALLLLLWFAQKMPTGAEKYLLEKLRSIRS